jgi:hypothetical protein
MIRRAAVGCNRWLAGMLRREWCRVKELNPHLSLLGGANHDVSTVSLVWVGAYHQARQERGTAPHICHYGVCIVHDRLHCNEERLTARHCQKCQAQPKRDINRHSEARL